MFQQCVPWAGLYHWQGQQVQQHSATCNKINNTCGLFTCTHLCYTVVTPHWLWSVLSYHHTLLTTCIVIHSGQNVVKFINWLLQTPLPPPLSPLIQMVMVSVNKFCSPINRFRQSPSECTLSMYLFIHLFIYLSYLFCLFTYLCVHMFAIKQLVHHRVSTNTVVTTLGPGKWPENWGQKSGQNTGARKLGPEKWPEHWGWKIEARTLEPEMWPENWGQKSGQNTEAGKQKPENWS